MRRAPLLVAIGFAGAASAEAAAGELVLENFRVQAGPGIVLAVQSVRTPACDPSRAPLLVIADAEPERPLAAALADAGYPVYRLTGREPAPAEHAGITEDTAALASWIRARHGAVRPPDAR